MDFDIANEENLDKAEFKSKYEDLLRFMLEKRGIAVVPQFQLDHPWGKNKYDLCIPDFKLIIEVDGSQHITDPAQKEKDVWRRRTARDHGYRMLRFTNRQIYKNPTKTLEMIMRYRPDGPRGLNTLRKF